MFLPHFDNVFSIYKLLISSKPCPGLNHIKSRHLKSLEVLIACPVRRRCCRKLTLQIQLINLAHYQLQSSPIKYILRPVYNCFNLFGVVGIVLRGDNFTLSNNSTSLVAAVGSALFLSDLLIGVHTQETEARKVFLIQSIRDKVLDSVLGQSKDFIRIELLMTLYVGNSA